MSGETRSIGETEPVTLVVGEGCPAERVRSAMGGTVVPVGDYLAALGEMAHRRVAAVVGEAGSMGVSMDPTVRGLRELAPAARLVLLADAEEEPRAMRAVRLGFDDYLIRPFSADELARSLEGAAEAAAESDEAEGSASPGTLQATEGNGAVAGDPMDGLNGLAEPGALVGSGGARRLTRGTSADEAELIDRLLRGQHDLRDAAMETVRHRLDTEDIQWSPVIVRDHRGCVAVSYEGAALGYLVSATVPAEQLEAEAAWLGRWVAMARHIGALTEMAFRDEMTGLRNRRYFDRFLRLVLGRARAERFQVTLMVYDIDDFKAYNDRFGHEAGDEILRETAKLMGSVVRRHDVVARIGGDEFAVIFWDAEARRRRDSTHPQDVRSAAERFQRAVCDHQFPKLAEQAPGTLTISGGLASYPWDGQEAEELLQAADRMLLESKRQGKNAITFGPGAVRACGMRGEIEEAPAEED